MESINATTKVNDVLRRHPLTGEVFIHHGSLVRSEPGDFCIGYPDETVGEYAKRTDVDLKGLLHVLNTAAEATSLEAMRLTPRPTAGGPPPEGPIDDTSVSRDLSDSASRQNRSWPVDWPADPIDSLSDSSTFARTQQVTYTSAPRPTPKGTDFRKRGSPMIRALGVLSGLTMAALVLSLAGWVTGQRLVSQILTAPPSSDPKQPAEQPHEKSVSAVALQSANSVSSHAPSDEPGGPANAGTDESASSERSRFNATMRATPKPSVTSPQPTNAPSTEAATPNAMPRQSGGPYRAELTRAPVSRGWGDSYAVRLSNSAGQPVKLSGVLLVAHMADGSVENIAMGALPEPGMYRGTVPTGRSTPVDLRVRVRTGDKFIQIPLTP